MTGDDSAFPAFFERRHAELSRLAYLLTGDGTAADDLAADALGQMRRAWPRMADDDPAALARGLVAALARRHDRRRWFGPGRRAAGAGGMRAAVRRLPYRLRVCVVLRYACGLSEAEAARALGVSPGAVRSRTSRGVRRLKELLGGSLEVIRPGGREAAW